MWEATTDKLQNGQIFQYFIQAGGEKLTYAQVVRLWLENTAFRGFFSELLANSPFEAFFWETPPLTHATAQHPFECVLVNSPQLAGIQVDSSAFRQYFVHATESICNFSNLGGDALLLAPVPEGVLQNYGHLATFVRKAPAAQQQALWKKLGKILEEKINEQPLWVSTSGLGVYWLHVRLDSRPKYYQFAPYKNFSP